MQLTTEQLIDITAWANKGMSPKEIAIIMELDREEFIIQCAAEESEIEKAYFKGYYMLVAEHNAKLIEQGKQGNSLAQDKVAKLIIELQNKKLNDE